MTIRRLPGSGQTSAVALFRYGIIAALIGRDFDHGELRRELKALARKTWRPPGSDVTRTYGASTIERWFYCFRAGGYDALVPTARGDRGRGRALVREQKKLLIAIRREFPTASAPLILMTLEREGQLKKGQISVATINRFFAEHGLVRRSRKHKDGPMTRRLRWEAAEVGALWHSDVCHGPTLTSGGKRTPIRIHALLDDKSRYVIALAVYSQEREVEMLSMMASAVIRVGVPRTLYVDNGSTYRGDGLAGVCSRLGIGLVHAAPYDPQARGKMERFWRTLREQCLDFIGPDATLHEVSVRLHAWLDEHYQRAPHAGLMGRRPEEVWSMSDRATTPRDAAALCSAFTVRQRRKVRGDNTLAIDGVTYQLDAGFLAGKTVTVARCLPPLDAEYAPCVEYGDLIHELSPVDPVANAKRGRKKLPPPAPAEPTGFDPNKSTLDMAAGRRPSDPSEVGK